MSLYDIQPTLEKIDACKTLIEPITLVESLNFNIAFGLSKKPSKRDVRLLNLQNSRKKSELGVTQ